MELEKTWGRVVPIWWVFVWRGMFGGFVLGGAIGAVIGFVGTLLGFPRETLATATTIIVLPIGILWGFVVIRMALKKKYRGFRIALLPADSDHVEVFS